MTSSNKVRFKSPACIDVEGSDKALADQPLANGGPLGCALSSSAAGTLRGSTACGANDASCTGGNMAGAPNPTTGMCENSTQ